MKPADRKAACKRLAIELGARKLRMEAAKDPNEIAFAAAELAQLFQDNLDFIIMILRKEGGAALIGNLPEIVVRSILDLPPPPAH